MKDKTTNRTKPILQMYSNITAKFNSIHSGQAKKKFWRVVNSTTTGDDRRTPIK